MQSVERSNKVAAIDGRNERCIAQRLQCLGVVPVEEMPTKGFQLGDGCKSAVCQNGKFRYRQESKFARSLARIQQKADVGWRDARSLLEALLFNIVRDK